MQGLPGASSSGAAPKYITPLKLGIAMCRILYVVFDLI